MVWINQKVTFIFFSKFLQGIGSENKVVIKQIAVDLWASAVTGILSQ